MSKPTREITLENLFKALADSIRLRLLNLIGDQEVCVCFFVEALDVPQPTISRHLAYLRRVGLVHARRDGKWMHYRVVMPGAKQPADVLRASLKAMQSDAQYQRDRARLSKACCGPSSLVQTIGAPLPAEII